MIPMFKVKIELPSNQPSGFALAASAFSLALVLFAPSSRACGPNFSERVLDTASPCFYTSGTGPALEYLLEIKRLRGKSPYKESPIKAKTHDEERLLAEQYDLEAALKKAGTTSSVSRASQATAVQSYLDLRSEKNGPMSLERIDALPAEIPREFRLYLKGVVELYHPPKESEVVQPPSWLELLKLPPAQRRYRTTWALFMLGVSRHDDRASDALFEELRQASRQHQIFSDTLGLAVASYGRTADMAGADHTALIFIRKAQQALTGYEYYPHDFLRDMRRALKGPDHELLAKAPIEVLSLMAAALSQSRGNWGDQRALLLELRKGVGTAKRLPMLGARLAMAAYWMGDFESAAFWLQKADARESAALWVRGRLRARDGKFLEAAKLLKSSADVLLARATLQAFDTPRPHSDDSNLGSHEVKDSYVWWQDARRIYGQAGALFLRQGRNLDALESFLRGARWIDAAYVAERMLSLEELRSYVQSLPVKGRRLGPGLDPGQGYLNPHEILYELRALTARRCFREGKLQEGMTEWQAAVDAGAPRAWLERAQHYVELRSKIEASASTADNARSKAIFEAAQFLSDFGMATLGTEVEPDWRIFRGNYEVDPVSRAFAKQSEEVKYYDGDWLSSPSLKEEARWFREKALFLPPAQLAIDKKNGPHPDRRFHYRYLVADLAWEAAGAVQDDLDFKSQVLKWGGLKSRNLNSDLHGKFYQAMLKCCAQTPLGRALQKTGSWDSNEKATR